MFYRRLWMCGICRICAEWMYRLMDLTVISSVHLRFTGEECGCNQIKTVQPVTKSFLKHLTMVTSCGQNETLFQSTSSFVSGNFRYGLPNIILIIYIANLKLNDPLQKRKNKIKGLQFKHILSLSIMLINRLC